MYVCICDCSKGFTNLLTYLLIAAKTQKDSYQPGVLRELKREGHIMISYQWSHQKTLLMIKEELVRNGFKVRLGNGSRSLIAISNEHDSCL